MGIKKVLVSGNMFLKIRMRIDRAIAFFGRKIFYSFGKIDNKKIFIMTYDNNYICNPSYIADELVKRKLPIDIVWVGHGKATMDIIDGGRMSPDIRVVRRGSLEMFEEQASAKVWIDNALNCVWYGIPKKKNQVYINTWHGSMGIKKLSGNKFWLSRAKKCKKYTDYCVSNSKFEENVYHDTFWKNVPLLKYGHPRNDMLFDKNVIHALKAEVRNFFEISGDKKILLYAPTFRDNRIKNFDIDYTRLKEALEKKFGGDWVILVRLHHKNKAISRKIEYNEWLINASLYPDMQPLMTVADMGITDYSSWAYDFILTGNPLVLYVPDVEEYDQDRGFYFTIESTPFILAHDNDELEKGIEAFDNEVYQKKIREFLEDKGCYEDGNATKRVVDKIVEIMGL